MTLRLSRARAISDRVISELAQYCDKIEVAGSIRRERPNVHDIDIVCLPRKDGGREAIIDRVQQRCRIDKKGSELIRAIMADNVQIDIWIARHTTIEGDLLEQRTVPGNFGSVLLCRTGSKEHNIDLINHAKSINLTWHPHDGVMKNGRVIASETEDEIFAALKLKFIPVRYREPGRFSFSKWMRVGSKGSA
jgi:DNA polymerase IV (family X)